MPQKIRLGVIGCGDVAVTKHFPCIVNSPDVILACVCDTRKSVAEDIAQRLNTICFTDVETMLRECELDAVIVATPPWVTPQITIQALKKGLYVLCEKPMAVTVEQAMAVKEAEKASSGRVQVGFTYHHDPLLGKLREWIAGGRLGGPLLYRIGIFDETWDPEENSEHYDRIFRTMEHGSPSIHDGAHMVDFLNLLSNSKMTEIESFGFKSRPEFPTSNYDLSVIHFENGDIARMELGWFFPAYPFGEFEVIGPKGYATYHRLDRKLTFTDAKGEETVEDQENWWTLCFRIQLQKFVNSVRNRTECDPGCDSGIYNLSMCKKIEASIQKKMEENSNEG